MTQKTVDMVAAEFAAAAKAVYGDKLEAVILFGSCARGDFQPDSDIDFMILLNVDAAEIRTEKKKLQSVRHAIDQEHDVLTAPIVQSYQTFQHWLPVMPFYQNVMKEGKKIA